MEKKEKSLELNTSKKKAPRLDFLPFPSIKSINNQQKSNQ